MCEKKCCPLLMVLAVILVLAAIAATVYLVLKKMDKLSRCIVPIENGYFGEKDEDNDVPFTTDRDFVE